MGRIDEKKIKFRFATVEDASKILKIYEYYIKNTTIKRE